MTAILARAKLARQASRLNAGANLRTRLPSLVLLTDDDRLGDPVAAVRALPRRSLVIVRAQDARRRAELAVAISRIARGRLLVWLIADDPDLALRLGADGVHFPEKKMACAGRWRARRPRWLITCAAHSGASCIRAGKLGADAVLLAPVFGTASHPGRRSLGPLRTRMIARICPIAIYALGGIDAFTAQRLSGARLVGFAAVGALAD